jgi:hypothetical protein
LLQKIKTCVNETEHINGPGNRQGLSGFAKAGRRWHLPFKLSGKRA